MNEKEMLMKQLRANAFPHNNGKVMQAINIIRHSYRNMGQRRAVRCRSRVDGAQGTCADGPAEAGTGAGVEV